MTKQLLIFTATLILSLAFNDGHTQGNASGPRHSKWMPEKGFWVIEGNVKTPARSTICFYTDDKVLVYKERVDGIQLNLKRKKVLIRLSRVLEQSIAEWEAKHVAEENKMLVASLFK